MMKSFPWAGAGLGLVAAAVFASATTGPMLVRLILFFITPLAIALAGLGWGWRSALLAGGIGTGLVMAFAGPLVALAFAATQAVPMAVLTYLAALSRVGDGAPAPGAQPAVEWYPPGRIVLWAAAMAGALSVATLLLLSDDLDGLKHSLETFIKAGLETGLPQGDSPVKLSDEDLAAISEMALYALPAASAISWMSSLLFNLWLAGRVTLASGQLVRPWPDLAAITYPPGTPLVFGAVLLATFIGGYASLAAWGFAGALFLAYLLAGLAVVHFTTRGKAWRPFALWGLYGALLILDVNVLVALAIAMLGLGDTVLRLRARAAPSDPPIT